MAKFSVGDKVRVREGLVSGKCYDDWCNCNDSMAAAAGAVAEITEVDEDEGFGRYRLKFQEQLPEASSYAWSDSMLEPLVTLKELPETGVHVKTREEYDELMRIYENAGWRWAGGEKPTEFDGWGYCGDETCVRVKDGFRRGDKPGYLANGYTVITLDMFKKKQGLVPSDTFTAIWSKDGVFPVTVAGDNYQEFLSTCSQPKKPKTTMAKLSIIAKKALSPDYRAMVKAGVLDSELDVTNTDFFIGVLLATNDEFRKACAAEARKLVKENKEVDEE